MTHKTQREPRRSAEKVPFQLAATLGYMFSIVGWLAGQEAYEAINTMRFMRLDWQLHGFRQN